MGQSSLNPKRIADTPRIYVASLADYTAGRLLGRWIDADQPAEAIIQEIQANQKITQDVLEALPYTGEALDLIAAVTGESLSGEQLSGWERFFRAACSAGPAALEEALKRSPRAQEAIGQLLAATGEMSSEMKNALLRRIGADVDKFDQFADDAIKFLTKERSVFGRNVDDVVDAAKNGYRQTAEGIEDLRQLEKAKDASRQTINELDDLVKKGGKAGDADMENVIIRMQQDKTAQSLMNSADVPPQLEKAMDIFKQVDRGAISPKQAEHMLEQLGNLSGGGKLTPQKVVENMAHYFEAVENGPGKAFRSIKTAELARTLDGVTDMSRRTDLINEAYRGGQISGETFRQMREGAFRLPPNPTPQQRQQLKDWAIGAWGRRAISLTEKRLIEVQTGPLDQ